MMRGLNTTVRRIRRKVFEEVARLGFQSNDETLNDDMEAIPYAIVNEDSKVKYRESVYRARAIVRERLRLAMGLSLRPENRPVHLTVTLAETERTLTESEQTLAALLGTFARGRVLKSGAATAIVGAPNAGKSSLLNALVGYDRAIVTDLPGTTRDTVEEKAVVGGVLLRLIDTAGIRETDDAVERLGVERSRRAVESADLVIVVADGSHTPLTVEPDILALAAQAPHWILAISKDDRNPAVKTAVWRLPDGAPVPEHLVSFNSVMPGGLDALIDTIRDCFPAGVPAGGTLLTNARQAEAVDRALNAVRAAHEALTAGLTPDVVLTEAEGALDALGELTGRTAREDMVTRIFERFCVGK